MGYLAETHSNLDVHHDFFIAWSFEVFIKLDPTLLEGYNDA